jgi:hypothetical protein
VIRFEIPALYPLTIDKKPTRDLIERAMPTGTAIIAPSDAANPWYEARTIRNSIANRRRRHGRGISRPRHTARSHGCHQSTDLRPGSGKQVGVVADKLTNLQFARISPQGDRVVMQIDSGINDVWVLDLARGVRTRLTFGPNSNMFPLW